MENTKQKKTLFVLWSPIRRETGTRHQLRVKYIDARGRVAHTNTVCTSVPAYRSSYKEEIVESKEEKRDEKGPAKRQMF